MLWPKPHGVIAAAPLIRTLTERRVGVNSPAVAGGGPPMFLTGFRSSHFRNERRTRRHEADPRY